jgi:hypothetical protein
MVRANSSQLIFGKRANTMLCRLSKAANSLSLNILPLTPLDPRFWQTRAIPALRNRNEFKILQIQDKKIAGIQFALSSPASFRVLCFLCGLSLASQ